MSFDQCGFLMQVFTDKENLDSSVKLVLGAFGEKATSCHQPMWDMILLFSKNIPQAWGCNSIRKAVLPKLWDFLKQGCVGSQQMWLRVLEITCAC
jgi:hypothetical protein